MTAGKLAQLATRGRSSRIVASEAKRELAWMSSETGGVHLIKMRPLLQVLKHYMVIVIPLVKYTAASKLVTSTSPY